MGATEISNGRHFLATRRRTSFPSLTSVVFSISRVSTPIENLVTIWSSMSPQSSSTLLRLLKRSVAFQFWPSRQPRSTLPFWAAAPDQEEWLSKTGAPLLRSERSAPAGSKRRMYGSPVHQSTLGTSIEVKKMMSTVLFSALRDSSGISADRNSLPCIRWRISSRSSVVVGILGRPPAPRITRGQSLVRVVEGLLRGFLRLRLLRGS